MSRIGTSLTGMFGKKQPQRIRPLSRPRPQQVSARRHHPMRTNPKGLAKRFNLKNPDDWFVNWVGGGSQTSSGANVNQLTAMQYTPFWASVRIISGTLAFLPFLVYERKEDGKVRKPTHPAFKLLHDRANDFIDALTLKETLQAHALTYGNGYAEIQRNGAGRPIALWPLLPNRVWRRIGDDGKPFYELRMPDGTTTLLDDLNVLHIKGLGFDGYTGYNVVAMQKEAIGYGIAVKEYAGRFFSGDATPGGVLEHPQNLSETALKNLYNSWNNRHQGLNSGQRLQILEEGMKYNPIGVNPEQAQSLEVQKYTVDDCARIFNIPPHKIASMERATFSNIEEQNLDFVSSTMMYWFSTWEAECDYKMFMPTERGRLFCEILAEGLLRGKAEQRNKGYAAGRQWGWLSVNDIRRLENLNTIGPEGDIYLEPLNMKPAGTEDPVDPEPEPDDGDNDADRAHRELIASTFQRVITKYTRSGHKPNSRTWADKIMFDPVFAYGSSRGIDPVVTSTVLCKVLDEYVSEGVVLEDDHATIVANRIITELGGNNAAQTK